MRICHLLCWSDFIPDKMSVRFLGLALLAWLSGALHAQSAAQHCLAPRLVDGFFVPVQEMYSQGTKISFACDNGHKPPVEGWWAISTCRNGTWDHEPQCIDKKACIPPVIPNGKYTENSNNWYKEEAVITIKCDKGYEPKHHLATAKCVNGTWSSLPICEQTSKTCSEPPKVSNAVVIGLEYQKVFPANSGVQYQCEDGYTIEGVGSKKSIFCVRGTWTEGPMCSPETKPSTTSSAAGGTDGEQTSPTGSGTSSVGGGSSSDHGLNDREIEAPITQINHCDQYPHIQNGDIVHKAEMFLRYQCNSFYTLVGPETVMCHADGTWSEVPTCKAAYCSVDTDTSTVLESVGVKYVKNGERVTLKCVKKDKWWTDHYSVVRCIHGTIQQSDCCVWISIKLAVAGGMAGFQYADETHLIYVSEQSPCLYKNPVTTSLCAR